MSYSKRPGQSGLILKEPEGASSSGFEAVTTGLDESLNPRCPTGNDLTFLR